MGYTLEITATRSLGLVSTAAMAARRPAPPPPTMSTSQEEISMRAQVFQAAKLLCCSLDVNRQGWCCQGWRQGRRPKPACRRDAYGTLGSGAEWRAGEAGAAKRPRKSRWTRGRETKHTIRTEQTCDKS